MTALDSMKSDAADRVIQFQDSFHTVNQFNWQYFEVGGLDGFW